MSDVNDTPSPLPPGRSDACTLKERPVESIIAIE